MKKDKKCREYGYSFRAYMTTPEIGDVFTFNDKPVFNIVIGCCENIIVCLSLFNVEEKYVDAGSLFSAGNNCDMCFYPLENKRFKENVFLIGNIVGASKNAKENYEPTIDTWLIAECKEKKEAL